LLKYLIMGPQGSGKGTQARMLARDLDLVHISIGDMFRWHVQSRTKLGTSVQRYLEEGRLVPDETVFGVVRSRLEIHDWRFGFVLDGFPRNAAQADLFLQSYDVDAVIVLELPEQAAVDRIRNRRLCAGCGRDINLVQLPPKAPDVCDDCGGPLVTRPDDTADAIRTRLADYRQKTQPILDRLRRKHAIVTVDGAPAPEAVRAEIRRRLALPPTASASRPGLDAPLGAAVAPERSS
jgi:adenylate kinase